VETAGAAMDEGGDLGGRESGLAVDKEDVATDAEGGRGAGELDGFGGGRGARHEGCAGEDAVAMQFEDGPVDARGQSKVVGIHDEAGHGLSLWMSLSRGAVRARLCGHEGTGALV